MYVLGSTVQDCGFGCVGVVSRLPCKRMFFCHPLRSRDNQAGPIVLGFTAGGCQLSTLLVEIPPGCNLSLAKAVLTAGSFQIDSETRNQPYTNRPNCLGAARSRALITLRSIFSDDAMQCHPRPNSAVVVLSKSQFVIETRWLCSTVNPSKLTGVKKLSQPP